MTLSNRPGIREIVEIEIETTEEAPRENEASEAEAFAQLSEVHSDRAEEHCEEASENAEEAESAAIVALSASVEATDAAESAALAATATTLSNDAIAQRLDALPGEIAAAIHSAMSPPELVEVDEETGDVVPVVEPDEAPTIQKKWWHSFVSDGNGRPRGSMYGRHRR